MSHKMFFLSDLFEVQQRAIEEAGDKPGFAYFMEQGLGKTRTVLYEFHFKAVRGLVDVLVVVVPRPLRSSWKEEAEELGFPYPVVLLESDKKTFARLNELRKSHRGVPVILVMHYEQVLTHGSRVLERLLEMGKRIYCALDESVRIKAHDSVIGNRLWELGQAKTRVQTGKNRFEVRDTGNPKFTYRRVLSGTPAPQGAHDLWGQFRFIGEMERTPYFAFRNLYCKMGGFQNKSIKGYQNLDILRVRTGPYAFRAKKVDWTDLPEKLWAKPREVDMTEEQRRAYLEIMHDFVLELGPDDFVTVEMAITVKGKLQQIASGWVYDNDKNVREIVPLEKNPKLQEAKAVIEECSSKILVFYFFKPTRTYLEQLAQQLGVKYVVLAGSDRIDGRDRKVSDEEFAARKRAFNEDPEVKVAFCQTDSVKEGHTLLGTPDMPCHNTLFVENTYSLYARAQAEDRNHRHGQRNPVTYHDIAISREDKEIIKALQRKAGMQEAILGEFTSYNDGVKTVHMPDPGDTGETW